MPSGHPGRSADRNAQPCSARLLVPKRRSPAGTGPDHWEAGSDNSVPVPTIVGMPPPKDARWSTLGRVDGQQYSATTLSSFWPDAEHRKLIARWPRLAAVVGATWDEHRQQVERHCALVARAGYAVSQVSGDVAGLEAFLGTGASEHCHRRTCPNTRTNRRSP